MNLTGWILIVSAALLILYDVYTLFTRGKVKTISFTVYAWAKLYPIVPFTLGVIAGHLMWPICG